MKIGVLGLAAILASASAQNTFIQNSIALLRSRGGNGVCIDFESMPVSQKANFTSFVQNLSKKIHDSIPGLNGTSWRVRAMVTMTGSGPLTVTPYVRCLHL